MQEPLCRQNGVRCDLEHQQPGASETPDAAESLCSADRNCGGLYDKGCNGQPLGGQRLFNDSMRFIFDCV